MKSEWQLKRERERHTEARVRLFVGFIIILAVLILQSIAHGLPSNMTAAELGAELEKVRQEEQVEEELSRALFAEAHRRARQEVAP